MLARESLGTAAHFRAQIVAGIGWWYKRYLSRYLKGLLDRAEAKIRHLRLLCADPFSPLSRLGRGVLLVARAVGILAAALLAGSGAFILAFYYYSHDLPDYHHLLDYEPLLVTRVYAGDGQLIAEYGNQHRIFIPISRIPERLIEAFISAEDKNFYSHSGIDVLGVVRALLVNIRNVGSDRRPAGASTITQQVAKNFLLGDEVSIDRKVREVILALRIERSLSKDRILELYLNQIFLGFRSYGVASAALNYFNKSLNELTLSEVAFLAALPKGPNNYHPIHRREAAMTRRNWVLTRMAAQGYITSEQAAEAQHASLQIQMRNSTAAVQAEYFADEVKRQLIDLYGRSPLYAKGISIRTSLEPELQQLAHTALRNGLIAYDRRHGWRGPLRRLFALGDWQRRLAEMELPSGAEGWELALVLDNTARRQVLIGFADGQLGIIRMRDLRWARRWQPGQTTGTCPQRPSDVLRQGDVILVEVIADNDFADPSSLPLYDLRQIPDVQGGMIVMNPHNGQVLAVSGGFSYDASKFNRATQAQRQIGSAFKPFVFLSAFQQGFTPSTLVMDEPISITLPTQEKPWVPHNYSEEFYGPTTLRVALEHSRNIVTVRLAQAIGMERIAANAERFGIFNNMETFLSGALGSQDSTLLRLSSAYAMLVNGCKLITPSLINVVQDRYGRTLTRSEARECPECSGTPWSPAMPVPDIIDRRPSVADPRHCYQIVSILEGAVQRGTGRRLRALRYPIAGKTGTTNDNYDSWFIGFIPDLVVGVYIGFDQPRTLGEGETGSSLALPVFQEFMAAALASRRPKPFRIPPGVNLVLTNATDGQLAAVRTRDTIWEAFLPGSEPDGRPREVLGSGTGDQPLNLESPESEESEISAPAYPAESSIEGPAQRANSPPFEFSARPDLFDADDFY